MAQHSRNLGSAQLLAERMARRYLMWGARTLTSISFAEALIDQLFNSSEKRLARLLLLLANFGKEGSPQLITPNISQETLAEMIGTTRSRVSFFMNKFRKLGFITYNGKIEVNSSLLNAVLYDKPEIKREP
jgi:CRP/FNR family cyclic AMP-dependent transcriptional regulator